MKNIESLTRQYQTVTPEFSSKLCFTYCCEVLRQRKHQLWLVYYCWWPISVTLISMQDLGELWSERPYPPWDSGQNEKLVTIFCLRFLWWHEGIKDKGALHSLYLTLFCQPQFFSFIQKKWLINFLTFYLFFSSQRWIFFFSGSTIEFYDTSGAKQFCINLTPYFYNTKYIVKFTPASF